MLNHHILYQPSLHTPGSKKVKKKYHFNPTHTKAVKPVEKPTVSQLFRFERHTKPLCLRFDNLSTRIVL